MTPRLLLATTDIPPVTSAAAPRPVLLVAAAESFEEAGAARFIAAGSPASVTVWLAPGGHTGALGAAGVEWDRRVGQFLDAALGAAG